MKTPPMEAAGVSQSPVSQSFSKHSEEGEGEPGWEYSGKTSERCGWPQGLEDWGCGLAGRRVLEGFARLSSSWWSWLEGSRVGNLFGRCPLPPHKVPDGNICSGR